MKLCMTRVSQQGGWQFPQPIGRHAWRHVIFIYVTQLYYTVTELLVPKQTSVQFLKRTPTFRRGTHMCVRTILVRVAVLGV